jgi:hypothetical protein
LNQFTQQADVLQFCPCIGQTWADNPEPSGLSLNLEPPRMRLFKLPWAEWGKEKSKVAFFHGSTNLWKHRRCYSEHYQKLGYTLAASTIDYATEMGARYLPPSRELETVLGVARHLLHSERAALRADDDPAIATHTPTNPHISSSQFFLDCCRRLGIVARFVTNQPIELVMRAKLASNIGFDHLRGSFSVNHLENCILGLAALCSLKPQYAKRLVEEQIDPPPTPLPDDQQIVTEADLEKALLSLRDNPELTRFMQLKCRIWANKFFNDKAVGKRLVDFYTSL